MAKLNGPLFSLKASGKINKQLTYKTRNGRAHVGKYTNRGIKNITEPSMTQIDNRNLYRILLIAWQNKNSAEKKVYNDLVKEKKLPMSGFNYFVKVATQMPCDHIGLVQAFFFNQIVSGKIKDFACSSDLNLYPSSPKNIPSLEQNINVKTGKSINFDYVDDYAVAPYNSKMNTPYYTMCFWITPKSKTTLNYYISRRTSTSVGFILLALSAQNEMIWDTYKNNTQSRLILANFWGDLNKPYFIALQFSNTFKRMYVNGIQKSTSSAVFGPNDSSTLGMCVGGNNLGASQFGNFKMDTFLHYNRILTTTELNAIMKATDPTKKQ
jgi:hypothetical protein